MEENINKIKSTAVLEMIRVAHEFNIFSEDIAKKETKDIIGFYQKVLPLMYIKAALLPEIEVSDPSANERYVAEEHWERIYVSLKEKFGKADEYWELDENNDSIKVSLSEKMADVYQDTKDFVVLFQKNQMAAKENAVFEMHRLFKVHWGPRSLSVLNQLHTALYQADIDKENELAF